jgi:hypothetical protein
MQTIMDEDLSVVDVDEGLSVAEVDAFSVVEELDIVVEVKEDEENDSCKALIEPCVDANHHEGQHICSEHLF